MKTSEMKRVALAIVLVAVTTLAFATTTFPLVITKLETKDWDGYVRSTFRRGEIVVVETEIAANPAYYYYYYFAAPMSYLQIITMYSGGYMVGLTLTRATISPGESKVFGGGMQIRLTDPLGTYSIEVYVWNGFPSEMGTAHRILAARRVVTITVTG